jgi:dihydroorotase
MEHTAVGRYWYLKMAFCWTLFSWRMIPLAVRATCFPENNNLTKLEKFIADSQKITGVPTSAKIVEIIQMHT